MADLTRDFSGKDTIDTALQLIRYDIPCLILGKSSIGKSYTLIKITEKWRLPHALLYIGSEKSENIEGVPKLTERKKGKEILEYLQPYWFPNADVITKMVANGRNVFDRFIDKNWDVKGTKGFKATYENLMSMLNAMENIAWTDKDLDKSDGTYSKSVILEDLQWISQTGGKAKRVLNKKEFLFKREGVDVRTKDGVESEEAVKDDYYRDDIADLCLYLTTCLGYGNYWLILDEIDKVEEMEKDKFAPLLHIVRERTLKNFRMIDINNGKGLGIPLGKNFRENGYGGIVENVNRLLDTNQSVLDTRVMAIANKTKNIEEALFRRFVQMIAEEVLIWRPEDLNQGETLIESCLTKTKDEMVKAGLESGSLKLGLKFQKLDEINLQWQYNFFPKMLNDNDPQGNFFKANALDLKDDSDYRNSDWFIERTYSAFYKLLEDNFRELKTASDNFNIASKLYNCLEAELIPTGTDMGISKKTIEEEIKGVRGILSEKERDIGDPSLIAFEIAERFRNGYPKKTVKETDKLTAITNWSNNLIEYLRAAIFSSEIDIAPLELSKHLIPALTNVFYTEIGKDKEISPDNIIPSISKFQAFWKDVYEINPAFSYKCDEDATEEAFFGGKRDEMNALDDDQKREFSQNTFFGVNEEYWIQSASGQMTMTQTREGLDIALPLLVQEQGIADAAAALLKYEGAVEFLQAYMMEDLEELERVFNDQYTKLKAAKKETAANVFYESKTLVEGLIAS